MMDTLYFIAMGTMAGLFALYAFIDHYFIKPHRTSYVLTTLFKHFELRREQLLEFRIAEDRAKRKDREFEVKTIHHKYYRVVIENLKVILIEEISGFTVGDHEWYMRGLVDPSDLSKFTINVRETDGEYSAP